MEDPTTRLRALGYHQDLQERWVHGRLGVWLMDPALLLGLDPDEVTAFHDEHFWADLQPAPRPLMDAELSRAINQAELSWNGWLGNWSSPSGLTLTLQDVEDLGPEGLQTLENQRLEWLAEHSRRRMAGCAGMGLMITWLGIGWAIAGSVTVWLLGMALIAIGSWLTRPSPWPSELDPEGPDPEVALKEGQAMLGEAWHSVALLIAPIPVDTDHVHFLVLERTIALAALHEHFTPGGFMRILHAVEPLEEDLGPSGTEG